MHYERTELTLMLDSVYPELEKVSQVTNVWADPISKKLKAIDSHGIVYIVSYRQDKNGDPIQFKRRAENQPETPAKIRATMKVDPNDKGKIKF